MRMSRNARRRAFWAGAVVMSVTVGVAVVEAPQLASSAADDGGSRGGVAAARLSDARMAATQPAAESRPALPAASRTHVAEEDRASRLFSPKLVATNAVGWRAGHEPADRGGRVFHPSDEVAERQGANAARSATNEVVAAALTIPRPEASTRILAKLPKSLEAQVAAEAVPAKPAARPAPKTAEGSSHEALARLASFDPRPAARAGLEDAPIAAYQSADVPRPSLRPEVEAAAAVEANAEATPDGPVEDAIAAAIPLPSSRPETAAGEEVRVASLEPSDGPGSLGTASEEMTALAVPLPERRPAYQPPVVAAPQSQPAPAQQPAQRAAPQRAPAVASTRPASPGERGSGGIGGFFEKLFKGGGSAKLPGAGSGIAVYDISAQTVYLPGDGKLEAHSGLGHMQDNPRYVAQKMRGPTPPNLYNLRMREALFHGVEAIRLLPADGRKKYNRDGLLAHSYMYVGGGDRSQSNGCVVFKNYDRFLAAFKRGQVRRMIVVPSLDELPTYMAAL
ncbi:tlde1 domain-containing protein [Jiella avicenniae]|uniref:DUF2778 domain-containing protein n=1 Tax=Jiella avicenniae TaxID=2907202 RepID=A0A9X1NZ84_9HYPH|nr:tlde1 domain-containing protein [Jiella avicenniae]MCE7028545.1 DUF2778 domain-containing protein [Jiella avicenniae]